MPVQRGHFAFLDGLRGWAAFAVVFFHLRTDRPETDLMLDALPPVVVDDLAGRGNLGVAVFFVLSGLVIAYSLRSSLADLDGEKGRGENENHADRPLVGENDRSNFSFGNFMFRRVARLTPPYYAAILVSLAFAAGAAMQGDHNYLPGYEPFGWGRLAAHLVYGQELLGFVNFNDVFWTLAIEMQFYAGFALIVVAYRQLAPRWSSTATRQLLYGASATLALFWPLGLFSGDERAVLFLPLWYSFMLGVLIFARWQRHIPALALAAYLAILAISPLLYAPNRDFVLTSALTGVALWYAIENDRLGRWLSDPVSQLLGRISYSLYLFHTPVLGATLVAVSLVGNNTLWWEIVGVVVGVAAVLVSAEIAYRLVEAPAIAWGKRLKPTNRPASTAAPSFSVRRVLRAR